MLKSYSEMIQYESYNERLEYLMLGDNNVSSPRHMSMAFYKSKPWRETRLKIIYRDMTFDLGTFGIWIPGRIIVHHINPITEEDILNNSWKLYDPENLISTSELTSNIIHYGEPFEPYVERTVGDTKPWLKQNN